MGPPGKWPQALGVSVEVPCVATEKALTLGFPAARALVRGQAAGEYFSLLSVSSQVSWVRGCH